MKDKSKISGRLRIKPRPSYKEADDEVNEGKYMEDSDVSTPSSSSSSSEDLGGEEYVNSVLAFVFLDSLSCLEFINFCFSRCILFLFQSSDEDLCPVCGDGGELLCCDTCPKGFHLQCIDPPISSVPRGRWLCPECVQFLFFLC